MTTTHEHSRLFAVEVVRCLRQAGFQALWAGGCVRDHLLGRVPKDFDVATDARPQQVRELFGFRQTIPVGQAFGVITVLGPPQAVPIEVATFRKDVGYTDGRHPDSVRFCDPREDAQRRDFTINGLFYDPLDDVVHDYVGGREDLAAGIIRAIGVPSQRFEEDRLRMLRAIRFATVFAFKIEPQTLQAIVEQSHHLSSVSAERTTNELRRMLTHPRRALGLDLIKQSQLWASLPELLAEPLSKDGERFEFAIRWLEQLSLADFSAAVSILILSAQGSAPSYIETPKGWRELQRLAEAMKLSNQERDCISTIIRSLPPILRLTADSWPEAQPFIAGIHGARCLEVAEAYSRHTGDHLEATALAAERFAWPAEKKDPRPLLDGEDLKALGLKPGPQFSNWLNQVRRQQLLGQLDSHEAAREWIIAQVQRSRASLEPSNQMPRQE